jgi:hypothetical protein
MNGLELVTVLKMLSRLVDAHEKQAEALRQIAWELRRREDREDRIAGA